MRAVDAIKNIPDQEDMAGWYENYGMSERQFDQHVRRFYSGIFRSYAEAQGKSRWGEKTPFHIYHLEKMARLFPKAQFVGIVRHPGAVAVSLRRWNYDWHRAVTAWKSTTARMFKFAGRRPDRIHLLRYEDLVIDPETTLRDLLEFLGERWDPAVLEHGSVQAGKGTPKVVEGGTRSADPINTSRLEKWRSSVSEEELRRLKRIGPLLEQCGYVHDEPIPTLPMAPS